MLMNKCMNAGHNLLKPSQLTFTCSKTTLETLEKGVKQCSVLTIVTPERR